MKLSDQKEKIFNDFKRRVAQNLKDDFDVDFSNAIKEEIIRKTSNVLTIDFISIMGDEYNSLHSDYESIKNENLSLKARIKELQDISDTKRQIISFLDADNQGMAKMLNTKIENLRAEFETSNKELFSKLSTLNP